MQSSLAFPQIAKSNHYVVQYKSNQQVYDEGWNAESPLCLFVVRYSYCVVPQSVSQLIILTTGCFD